MVNCNNCGTELYETSLGRFICINCGNIVDDSKAREEDLTERERNYIG